MITQYFVCTASDKETLAKVVEKAIKRGWQPFGGVAVAVNISWHKGNHRTDIEETHEHYCQAVVKMAETDTRS
jgi:hypothetical protein